MSVVSSAAPTLARVLLLLAALAGAFWLARLDYAQKITVNVADLLPEREQDPEVQLLRSLVNDHHARSLWLVLRSSAAAAPDADAAAVFTATLAADPAFERVERVDDGESTRALGAYVFSQRFSLLLPGWLERQHAAFSATGEPPGAWSRWLADEAAEQLDAFLARPESAAFDELLPADPLLLLPTAVASAAWMTAPGSATDTPALIWARSRAAPLAAAGQEPVAAGIVHATTAARQVDGTVDVQWTGIHRFAAASRDRIRAEISWLNTGSLFGVLLVTTLLVRRPWRVLHLLPVVVLALLGAWVATTMMFEQVHILVFVLGALLIGAAIDYGFHVTVGQDPSRGTRGFARLRPVMKPLLGSCLTTLIGFSILWWSDLPLLRQLGVFVTAGLLAAVGAAVAYFGQLPGQPIEPRTVRPLRLPRVVRGGVLLAALLAAAGVLRLHWHDDIRELEVPALELMDNDRAVRDGFGQSSSRHAYLIRGSTFAEARARLAALQAWHLETQATPLSSVADLLPTEAVAAAAQAQREQLEGFPAQFRRALAERGYEDGAFDPFFTAWSATEHESPVPYEEHWAELIARLPGPLGQLLGQAEGQVWLVALAEAAPSAPPPAQLGVVELNQLQSLNRVFTRYRADTLRLSLAGLLLVVVSVALLYGVRRGARVLLLPLTACVVAFGSLGWLGQPLNLFHLLGAFLGVCLSHDYAIFATEARAADAAPPASIRLAACTTLASFGVLVFSRIPVISALGVTVTLIVGISLLLVELAPSRRA